MKKKIYKVGHWDWNVTWIQACTHVAQATCVDKNRSRNLWWIHNNPNLTPLMLRMDGRTTISSTIFARHHLLSSGCYKLISFAPGSQAALGCLRLAKHIWILNATHHSTTFPLLWEGVFQRRNRPFCRKFDFKTEWKENLALLPWGLTLTVA